MRECGQVHGGRSVAAAPEPPTQLIEAEGWATCHKANLQVPWLGFFVFVTLTMLLTLLIFIGEAVRDALDPRRAVAKASDQGAVLVGPQAA